MKRPAKHMETRFWEKVHVTSGCWEWIAGTDINGYGHLGIEGQKGKHSLAHRVSWELNIGPIPDGVFVLHHCDNPPCVRPDHLFLGTQADNLADMQRKGRRKYDRGEAIPQSKLTDTAVREILRSPLSERALATVYGVSHTSIGDVRRRKQWRHVI